MKKLACWINPQNVECDVLRVKAFNCGHRMAFLCYANSETARCTVDVVKRLPCQHEAIVSCSSSIHELECQTLVSITMPSCGHEQSVKCFTRNSPGRCMESVSVTSKCGHTETVACSDVASHRCSLVVERQLPSCGHSLHMKCSDDIESHANQCTTEVTITVCIGNIRKRFRVIKLQHIANAMSHAKKK
jgi:hypothetical protein